MKITAIKIITILLRKFCGLLFFYFSFLSIVLNIKETELIPLKFVILWD